MPRRPLRAQVFARLGRSPVLVAFDQPVLVVGPAEGADGGSQLVERVEALDPEQLLLERLDRFLGAAVRLGLVVEGGRAGDAEVVDLGLVVVGAEAGAAVVAQGEPGGDRLLDRAEALGADLAEQVGGGEAVDPAGGVVPDLVRGVVDEHEHRAAALGPPPRLGRVGRPERVRDIDGDRALV